MPNSPSQMNGDRFRTSIEAGDVPAVRAALEAEPALANRTISWYLNQQNESDPLHYVSDCVFNEYVSDERAAEVAALLIGHGARVEGTAGRESPLVAAVSLGAEAVARVLIEAGADLEATSVFGARALHWAAAMGLPSTVERLLERGAEIDARCEDFGATPLYWAAFGAGPDGPNKRKDPVAAAKVLIAAGATVDTANREGVTALECAQRATSGQMYDLLKQHTRHPTS